MLVGSIAFAVKIIRNAYTAGIVVVYYQGGIIGNSVWQYIYAHCQWFRSQSRGKVISIYFFEIWSSHNPRSRTNRVRHISRIAAEFNQLLYLMDKAKQDKCAFFNEVQWASSYEFISRFFIDVFFSV